MQTFTNHVTTAVLAFIIYSTGIGAIPLQSTVIENSLVVRADAVCTTYMSAFGFAIGWLVIIPGDDRFDGTNCGSGFLDNLRGHCGVITDWGCKRSGVDATITFLASDLCLSPDINAAIDAASGGVYKDLC